MDFMKVFDQTVREIKREVNLKVLKIPEIEQKVLDATDNEPWGPHGSALSEIAQATKKYSDCQIILNVLWTRLSETGKDWRYVYKALTVLEYLIANGSERAVDEIIEHTYRLASLASFEYVEPSGKDMGINVRKKLETIVALLNDKDKIQEARSKAAQTRDKYFGLSSTGITYKSSSGFGSASYGSSNYSGDQYGGVSGIRRGDSFSGRQKEKEQTQEVKYEKDTSKPRHVTTAANQVKSSKRGSTHYGSKDHDKISSSIQKSSSMNKFDKQGSHCHSSSLPSNNYDDDFDDFDPRGISSAKLTSGSSNEVDLFANFMDEPAPVAPEAPDAEHRDVVPDIDLFQDASFLSASTTESVKSNPQNEIQVDLFASQPEVSPVVDTFDAPGPVAKVKAKESASTANPTTIDPFEPASFAKVEAKEPASTANATSIDPFAPASVATVEPRTPANKIVDPFASVPLNSFDGSDLFGAFSAQTDPKPKDTSEEHTNDTSGSTPAESNVPSKKSSFQVKSGIWADSLSRGLIDLNITAPKKVNLADVGVVGDLGDASSERDKGVQQHGFYMGSAMGSGSGLGRSSFGGSSSSLNADAGDFFSSLSSGRQDNQFSSFKK
uniref:ENTH domain-containing protein n=1 Tax=Kalanchoe fedtschenkoi TaxID=63787 RepID=A0A7N0V628_KALFE